MNNSVLSAIRKFGVENIYVISYYLIGAVGAVLNSTIIFRTVDVHLVEDTLYYLATFSLIPFIFMNLDGAAAIELSKLCNDNVKRKFVDYYMEIFYSAYIFIFLIVLTVGLIFDLNHPYIFALALLNALTGFLRTMVFYNYHVVFRDLRVFKISSLFFALNVILTASFFNSISVYGLLSLNTFFNIAFLYYLDKKNFSIVSWRNTIKLFRFYRKILKKSSITYFGINLLNSIDIYLEIYFVRNFLPGLFFFYNSILRIPNMFFEVLNKYSAFRVPLLSGKKEMNFYLSRGFLVWCFVMIIFVSVATILSGTWLFFVSKESFMVLPIVLSGAILFGKLVDNYFGNFIQIIHFGSNTFVIGSILSIIFMRCVILFLNVNFVDVTSVFWMVLVFLFLRIGLQTVFLIRHA